MDSVSTHGKTSCKLCGWIQEGSRHERFVFESDACLVLAGEHQYFPGYVVLISKVHVREIFELSSAMQSHMFRDLSKTSRFVSRLTTPSKINLASLGNVEEHLHWHIFPRAANESATSAKQHPWFDADKFSQNPTSPADVAKLRQYFSQYGIQEF